MVLWEEKRRYEDFYIKGLLLFLRLYVIVL